MFLYALLTAAAIAVMGTTIAITAREYRSLPDRIPLHFGFDGTPGSYGPRAAIWLIVVIECVVLAAWSSADYGLFQDGELRRAIGSAIFRLCILGFMTQLQIGLISAAKAADQRLPMRPFWSSFVALTIAVIVTLRLF